MDSKLIEIKNLFHQLKEGSSNDNYQKVSDKILELSKDYEIEVNVSDLVKEQLTSSHLNFKNKSDSKEKDKNKKKDKEQHSEDKNLLSNKKTDLSYYASCLNKDNKINSGNVYVLSRLIGGLCSTGIEYRKGFCELLSRYILRNNSFINYNNLYEITNRESFCKKSESTGIKNALIIGKMCIFESIMCYAKTISPDVISKMMKDILINADVSINCEEYSIKCFNSFLNNVNVDNNKKLQLAVEDIIITWLSKDKSCLFSTSLYIIIDNIVIDQTINENNRSIVNYLINLLKNKPKYNIINNLFSEENNSFNNLIKFFEELIDNNNKSHTALQLLLKNIELICTQSKDNVNLNKLSIIYNTLTDSKLASNLIKVSNKNYQYVLTKICLTFINNIEDIKKLLCIFNSNFFKIFSSFEGGKTKNVYINQMISSLLNRLKTVSNKDNIFEDYCYEMLSLFDNSILSANMYKSFFLFLFGNLNLDKKETYISSVINNNNNSLSKEVSKMEIEYNDNYTANILDGEYYKNNLYKKVNILKSIITLKNLINSDISIKILDFFIDQYLSTANDNYPELTSYIEDKLMLVYWSLNCSSNQQQIEIEKLASNENNKYINVNETNKEDNESDNNDVKSSNDNKTSERALIKGIFKFNKHLSNRIKEKYLNIIDEGVYKKYKNSLIKVKNIIKDKTFANINNTLELNNNNNNNEKCRIKNKKVKILFNSILSLLLIAQVIYLKNSLEFEDSLFDFHELINKLIIYKEDKNKHTKLDNDFCKILTDLCIQLISLGSHIITEFVLKVFKKCSSYMDKSSVDILIDFIKS